MLCRHTGNDDDKDNSTHSNGSSNGSGAGVYVEAGTDIDSRGFPLAREAFGNAPDAVSGF